MLGMYGKYFPPRGDTEVGLCKSLVNVTLLHMYHQFTAIEFLGTALYLR